MRLSLLPRSLVLIIPLIAWTVASTHAVFAQSQPPKASPRRAVPDPAIVERRLIEAVRLDANSFEARQRLAAFYLQQGKLRSAIPHLARAQEINPQDYANGYDLALALSQIGRVDDARAQVRRMLQAKDAGELHNLLGDIEERAGNRTAAAAEYQRAAHMDPSEEHLFDWGNNLLQLKAFDAAVDVFTAAIPRHPRSARLHVGLGIARYSRGEYVEAVGAFCDAADLAPLDPRPYQFLGEMYGVSPDVHGEITTRLARFVEAQPENALAHFHYAMSLWKGDPSSLQPDDMRRIETLLRRAVAIDPTLAKGFLQLGILLADQERHPEAIRALQRATRLQGDLSQAHYRLAQLYQRTGQKELAAKQLEIFRRLASESREARR